MIARGNAFNRPRSHVLPMVVIRGRFWLSLTLRLEPQFMALDGLRHFIAVVSLALLGGGGPSYSGISLNSGARYNKF